MISMDEEALIGEVVTLLFAFASPNRYRILKRLCEQEMNVSALCHELDIHQSTLSRELSLLLAHGFLTQRREQSRHYYSCNHEGVKKLMKTLDEVLQEHAKNMSHD